MLGPVFAALLDVVLPQPCLGCGAPGTRLCEDCLAGVAAPARRDPTPRPRGLPVCWSAAPYEGAVRKAVIAYKERGEAALSAPLADLLAFTLLTALHHPQQEAGGRLQGPAGGRLPPGDAPGARLPSPPGGRLPLGDAPGARLPSPPGARLPLGDAPGARLPSPPGARLSSPPGGLSLPGAEPVSGDGTASRGGPVLVVPIPSRRAAVKGRGHDHVAALAERVVRRLREHGVHARLWPVLRHHRKVADQAGLSSSGRVANLAGSFSVPESAVRDLEGAAHMSTGNIPTTAGASADGRPSTPAGAAFDAVRVVVVDDVVTTGATLADAARSLRQAGATVPLAVTVAATRRISRNGYGDSQ